MDVQLFHKQPLGGSIPLAGTHNEKASCMKQGTKQFLVDLKTLFSQHGVWMGGLDTWVPFSVNGETVYIKTSWTRGDTDDDEKLLFRAKQEVVVEVP